MTIEEELPKNKFAMMMRASQANCMENATDEQIDGLYDAFVKLVKSWGKESPKTDEEEEENLDLGRCEQCGEAAWDGYICHACGMKII